jgi:putative membrane protein
MRLTFALVRVAIVAVALWVATKVVPGIGINSSSTGLLIAELVGWLAERLGLPFVVDGFWAAFWGAIVVAVVSAVLHLLIPNRLDAR